MSSGTLVQRKTILITFSKHLEYLLLSLPTEHISLTHDIEYCAYKGLELLEELEDVKELAHIQQITRLISETNQHFTLDNEPFNAWHIAVSEDLLDEIDLVILTHGEDLISLGLTELSQATVLVLLMTTGKYHPDCAAAMHQHAPVAV